MAIGTLTKVATWKNGNKRVSIYSVQASAGANYTTGGETVLPATVGLKGFHHVVPEPYNATQTRYFVFDRANQKLKVYTAFGTEAANNSDQSAFTVQIMFVGP